MPVRCELSDRLGGLSLPHDGGLSHQQDGGHSRPRRDIDNCDNTLRLPVPHLLSHLDGQQVHEICQETNEIFFIVNFLLPLASCVILHRYTDVYTLIPFRK